MYILSIVVSPFVLFLIAPLVSSNSSYISVPSFESITLLLGKEYKLMSHVRRISSSIMKTTIKSSDGQQFHRKQQNEQTVSISNHTHDHTFVMSWSLACCGKTIVSVQIHYILFSLRQTKHPSTTTFFHFLCKIVYVMNIYLLKDCLLIQVRRVTMATYQVISHNEKRTELWLRQT
jgi:hypothetical protein